jgi:diguanylate cyclase (GGDEF)-like protein/PAS domain S-box-containing protein
MKTIIIDENVFILEQFADKCADIKEIQLIGDFNSYSDSLNFIKNNNVELVFLADDLAEINSNILARRFKEIYPEIIIIFISQNIKFFKSQNNINNYYVLESNTPDEIESAVNRAIFLTKEIKNSIYIRTFGDFDIFIHNTPVKFENSNAKQFLAVIVDSLGEELKSREICNILFPDESEINQLMYYNKALRELKFTLKKYNINDLICYSNKGCKINTKKLNCDLFMFLDGDLNAIRSFNNSYMNGYQWGKKTFEMLKRQKQMFESYSDGMTKNTICASIRCALDSRLTIVYANESFLAITGYCREDMYELLSNSFKELVFENDREMLMNAVYSNGKLGKTKEIDLRLKCKSGSLIWVMSKGEIIKWQNITGEDSEWETLLIDISNRKADQLALKDQAQRDALTRLYNRSTGKDMIDNYLSKEGRDKKSALIILDVDNFKAINDTYGHPFADTVLTDIASILTHIYRTSDIISRIGGDEMMIFIKNIPSDEFLVDKINKTVEILYEKLNLKTKYGELSCSLGVAVYPSDADSFENLYSCADKALYCSKKKGKCQATVYKNIDYEDINKMPASIVKESCMIKENSIMCYAFNHLYGNPDLYASINSVLHAVGKMLDISRIYIFEDTDDRKYTVNTFEWCAEGICSEKNSMQKLPRHIFKNYYKNIEENGGLLYCCDFEKLPLQIYKTLKLQGVKSIIHCELKDENKCFGFVGFDECKEKRFWNWQQVKSLLELTRVISVFLRKYRLQHGCTLEKLQSNIHEMN